MKFNLVLDNPEGGQALYQLEGELLKDGGVRLEGGFQDVGVGLDVKLATLSPGEVRSLEDIHYDAVLRAAREAYIEARR